MVKSKRESDPQSPYSYLIN